MLVLRLTKTLNSSLSRHERAHKLLSQMLSEYTSHSYSEICVDTNGKPYIDGVAFSISHSGECAVVAMCVDSSSATGDVVVSEMMSDCVGVDVESIFDKSREKCERIAAHKFSDSERALLSKADDSSYIELFCKLWTAKESYGKYTGAGLADALSFDTQMCNPDVSIYTDVVSIDDKSYALSVCYNLI